jgi:1-hydroxycarotenoid 3,4-desaturase
VATPRVAVIGAGIAGLAAAIDLARSGCKVVLHERAALPGGKLREVHVAGSGMDAGPTVFTLRRVFDELFADAGDDFDRRLTLTPAHVLARHAWNAGGHLDLFADLERSIDSIAAFAGASEAEGFVRFADHAKRIYATLDTSFMRASRPSPVGLVRRVGLAGLPNLWSIKPFDTLWKAVGGYFKDPRLRQLFGRYATYCGSSPFHAPATLMLVAHVEQSGVWYVGGGMRRLVEQLAALAVRHGVDLRCASEVRAIHVAKGRVQAIELADGERSPVDAVVCNADNNALASGLFGRGVSHAVRATPSAARSLSAVTWNLLARTDGFALAHHSVFFSRDYAAEFTDIFKHRRLPAAPTVYVCAQDRQDVAPPRSAAAPPPSPELAAGGERLFCLINAPAIGDTHEFNRAEIEACEMRVFELLAASGLRVQRQAHAAVVTTPSDFQRLFPATGGALYGPASHGWRASFTRAGSRSEIPGLYLAGGSTHPGPGLPMAATSGRLAAACLMTDFVSTARSLPAATPGGTSMR